MRTDGLDSDKLDNGCQILHIEVEQHWPVSNRSLLVPSISSLRQISLHVYDSNMKSLTVQLVTDAASHM